VPNDSNRYSFAVFPFLKTSGAVTIGQMTVRSTDDATGLLPEQARQLQEISRMLFLKEHLRIRSASYTVVPLIDLDRRDEHADALEDLAHLQAVVAYCYASPHPIFIEPFLQYEHASLAIFSPGNVSIYVVRPDHHAEWVGPESPLTKDHRHEVDGYHGLYNFKHHFWVTNGSRLYPPIPHIGLNLSQDMAADLGQFLFESSHYPLLEKLLKRPKTATSERILRAIDWFNRANSVTASEEESIVNLAVALESLLLLPESDKKTERLVDSVSLVLGRIPRLDMWVRQFYEARSAIVHEGQAHNLRFVASPSASASDGPVYHSLLAYGRQVFQLCVGALLFGAGLAEEAGLQEKLVTNQERFDEINRELSDKTTKPTEKLRRIASTVQTAERYRFVPESDSSIEKFLNSVRLVSKVLLECDEKLEVDAKERLERIARAGRSDHYEILDAVRDFNEFVAPLARPTELDGPRIIAFRLILVVWGYTSPNYFWLRQSRTKTEPESGQSD